jgi:hypothetical protein
MTRDVHGTEHTATGSVSDLAGELEALLLELLDAGDWRLGLCHLGDGVVLIRRSALQEGTKDLAVLDPVRPELGLAGGGVTVAEQDGLTNIVAVELPPQVE